MRHFNTCVWRRRMVAIARTAELGVFGNTCFASVSTARGRVGLAAVEKVRNYDSCNSTLPDWTKSLGTIAAFAIYFNCMGSGDCDVAESGDGRKDFNVLLKHVDEIFRAEKESKRIPGMVYGVMKDGKLIHSVALGLANVEQGQLVTLNTRFRIASMSKSFTAMAIMKLRDEGHLMLDDPVTKYIPEFKISSGFLPLVTVRHLLMMAAGLPQDDPWADRLLDMSKDDFRNLLSGGVTLSNVPGYTFEYSNLGYAILGQIIDVISGDSYQNYIKNNILVPLGMNDTCYEFVTVPNGKLAMGYRWEDKKWCREPMLHDGVFGAMGGIVTTLSDFSKYVAFNLSAWPPSGNVDDNGPVSQATLREMHKSSIVDKILCEGDRPMLTSYGFGFRCSFFPDGAQMVGHAGGLPGFGSDFRFLTKHNGIAVIALANRTYAEMPEANLKILNLLLSQSKFDDIPVSNILKLRSMQLKDLILQISVRIPRDKRLTFSKYEEMWKDKYRDCFSLNFFEDLSVKERMKQLNQLLLALGGSISHFSPIISLNQLRGKFVMVGVNGKKAEVVMTMTPENDPRIQFLSMKLLPEEK